MATLLIVFPQDFASSVIALDVRSKINVNTGNIINIVLSLMVMLRNYWYTNYLL